MDTGLNDYFDFLTEGLKAPGAFRAEPYYKADADALFFYARDAQSYSKRLNPVLTLFLETGSNELVGFRIKGVQRILRAMDGLGIDKFVMKDKGLSLRIFVKFAQVLPPDDPAMEEYEEALEQYEDIIINRRELQVG